jgi:hypothetical protein
MKLEPLLLCILSDKNTSPRRTFLQLSAGPGINGRQNPLTTYTNLLIQSHFKKELAKYLSTPPKHKTDLVD